MGVLKTLADKVWKEGPTPSNAKVRQFTDEVDELVTNPVMPSYTVATLPDADPAGQVIFVTDESGGATIAVSDGTIWTRVQVGPEVS